MAGSSGLKKLARLYGMLEGVRSLELRAAAFAVEEVTAARAWVEQALRDAARQGHAGLAQGSRVELLAGAQTTRAAETLYRQLEGVRRERAQAHSEALETHRESRKELRQLERVIDQASVTQGREAERRAQAAGDDRFLARRAWLEAQQQEKPK
jgi:pantothenate synthetase